MNAVLSGSLGLALIIEDGRFRSFHVGTPDRLVDRSPAEYALLFAGAGDEEFLTNVTRAEVDTRLGVAVSRARALQAALLLIDGAWSATTRRAAATELETLLADAIVGAAAADHVRSVLYSTPLPPGESVQAALLLSAGPRTRSLLGQLVRAQPSIAEMRAAWEQALQSQGLHTDEVLEARVRTTRSGLFHAMVAFRDNAASLDDVAHRLPADTVGPLMDWRRFLGEWAAPIQRRRAAFDEMVNASWGYLQNLRSMPTSTIPTLLPPLAWPRLAYTAAEGRTIGGGESLRAIEEAASQVRRVLRLRRWSRWSITTLLPAAVLGWLLSDSLAPTIVHAASVLAAAGGIVGVIVSFFLLDTLFGVSRRLLEKARAAGLASQSARESDALRQAFAMGPAGARFEADAMAARRVPEAAGWVRLVVHDVARLQDESFALTSLGVERLHVGTGSVVLKLPPGDHRVAVRGQRQRGDSVSISLLLHIEAGEIQEQTVELTSGQESARLQPGKTSVTPSASAAVPDLETHMHEILPTSTEPPADRFCDLVMKGGITSGVVYPRAIEQLSHHYHFKNIGGTSAGAIAAAVTAAAEYQRRHTGSRAGFDLLKTLPAELQAEVRPGQRRLLSLFQPQPATRRLFSVLVNALNSGSTHQRILAMVVGAIKAYWPGAVGAAGLALLAWSASGLLAALLMLLVAGVGLIGWMVYRDVTGAVVDNGFGLCTGLGDDPQRPALTPWLHALIQRAAGRQPDDRPLTFGDLWAAPGHPPERVPLPPGATRRSIDLQMFSTNLGHGRPYIFPLVEQTDEGSRFRSRDRLFFSQAELARYLPHGALAWMVAHGRSYQPEAGREERDPSADDAARLQLLELPLARDFPVILAARMSLSFPLLFAALPLWAIDDDQVGRASFRRCWFSDGGISSNFPMHLFDGLVPSWPTFGINLEDQISGRPDTYLPESYDTGYGERWNRFDHESTDGASRFGGFFAAILGAMQNWNDNALSRMPGVRDRIARVRLKPTEGGLNLNMEGPLIEALAERGERAALALVSRFVADEAAGTQAPGWDEQRWVRLGLLLKMIQERAPGVLTALDPALPHATPLHALIQRAGDAGAPPVAGYEAPLSTEQQSALRAVVDALGLLVGTLAQPACRTDFKPVPRPELRVRPPL